MKLKTSLPISLKLMLSVGASLFTHSLSLTTHAQIAPHELNGFNAPVYRMDRVDGGSKTLKECYAKYIGAYLGRGARCIRLQLFTWDFLGAVSNNNASLDPRNYLGPLSEQLWAKYLNDDDGPWVGLNQQLDIINNVIVPVLRESGQNLKFIVDLHTPLGVYQAPNPTSPTPDFRTNSALLDSTAEYSNLFVRSWDTIARATYSLPECFGYDLQNEPSLPKHYATRIQQTINRIRNVGATRQWIFVESGVDPRSIEKLPLFRDTSSKVAFSVHWYVPIKFESDNSNFDKTKKRIVTVAKRVKKWQNSPSHRDPVTHRSPIIWIGEYHAPLGIGDYQIPWMDYVHTLLKRNGWQASFYEDDPSTAVLDHLQTYWSAP